MMKTKQNLKVFVISHKPPELKVDKSGYSYMSVGGNYHDEINDNSEEDNISAKNAYYCELTGMYWIWKHCHENYVGLCHYRRFFGHKYMNSFVFKVFKKLFRLQKKDLVVSNKYLIKQLKKYDIILPKITSFEIETVEQEYGRVHDIADLRVITSIIKQKYPDYYEIWKMVLDDNKCYEFNMLITSKSIFDKYSAFLFDILGESEKTIGNKNRVYGFISERLMLLFVLKEKLRVLELPFIKLNL